MCTVTFLPTQSGVILTSSRDEHISRGPAIAPQIMPNNGKPLIYPTDRKAGGSWFVINSDGKAAVLLNGAFEKHPVKESYRLSRGLMLLELFEKPLLHKAIDDRFLFNIEPFTLILWENNALFEFRWDGQSLFQKEMNRHHSHIWSSSTLYNLAMRRERQQWFNKWKKGHPSPSMHDALNFHADRKAFNKEYGISMNRSNGIRTMSITCAQIMPENLMMRHIDLINSIEFHLETVLPFMNIPETTKNQHVKMALAN